MLLSLLLFCVAEPKDLPDVWTKIETTQVKGEDVEVFFCDFWAVIGKTQPDLFHIKGDAFVKEAQKIQQQLPTYVVKRKTSNADSVLYYVLRHNVEKKEDPFPFDIEVVRVAKEFPLQSLENRSNYRQYIDTILHAPGCRSYLLCEHHCLIQALKDKEKIIGSGMPVTEGIITRVLPYKSIKASFFNSLETLF
ncbi:hypothetical protein [Paraflavitalea sp. CAU 1676]|uniref:hypothetical protein n=1 Tax=Paraflavitalea sp. CAU 1676 TaxID=3032598 RepID=UPI0023DA9960|nr:hypothetical protein [Paraflavitalea sp. CAU 1676]MDF2192558.1 hypothetical protein [Paraflavitalea sp. CAU 1676]